MNPRHQLHQLRIAAGILAAIAALGAAGWALDDLAATGPQCHGHQAGDPTPPGHIIPPACR